MTPRVQAENLIWELISAYSNKNAYQTKQMDEEFLSLKNDLIDSLVLEDRLRKQEGRIHRLIDKLTDILAITQETTDIPCWQKIQNIEATAANAIATDLNILEGDE